MSAAPHIPVMLSEVLDYLSPKQGEIYVDGTFGAGGYSEAILKSTNCKLVALDRDVTVVSYADKLKKRFGDSFIFVNSNFGDMQDAVAKSGFQKVDGIVLDIGVSSMQIDEAERGFSFMRDGALDMRMGNHGKTAADFINEADEKEISDVIYKFGEERHSRKIARAIVQQRDLEPFKTTLRLADTVKSVVRFDGKIHPATKTFQALRIYINDELGELERALNSSLDLLKTGGRLVIVTFHSLEDRIVKNFINDNSRDNRFTNRHIPQSDSNFTAKLEPLHKGAVKVSEREADENPRARSAKLRAARRL